MPTSKLSEAIRHLRDTVLRPEERSDGELLESFVRQRDGTALTVLIRRHGPMIWGVCRRLLHGHHDAEDALQATFLVFVRKAATIRDKDKLANWLYGVAHQTAVRARTALAKQNVREKQVTDMAQLAVTEQDREVDLLPLLDQALSCLPSRYRVAIILCDLEGKTRQEVARQLGWPEGTVAGRLARARTMLAKRLRRHGAVVSGIALAAVLSEQAALAHTPAPVVCAALQCATSLVATEAGCAAISPKVVALSEGVLRAMLLAKLKVGVSLFLVLTACAIGVGLLTHAALAQRPEDGKDQAIAERPKADRGGPPEPKLRATLNKHTEAVVAVAFSPNGKALASASQDKTVKLWDVATGKEWATLRGHTEVVVSVAFSPDGMILASASADGTLRLWDVASGKEIRAFAGRKGRENSVAFAPDGKTLAWAGGPGAVRLLDITTGTEIRTFQGHPCCGSSVVFAPDGKTIASAGRGPGAQSVLLWDVATGKEIRDLAEEHWPNSVTFAADGKSLATADKHGTVQMWDVATGKGIRVLTGHQGDVNSVAYAPDGMTLASAGADETVRLWDVGSGKELCKFAGHSAVFAPDGKTLASAEGTSILIWAAERFSLPQPARLLAPREVAALWDDLIHEEMPRSLAAVGALIQAPGHSVPFLRDRVKPIAGPDPQRLAKLMANLDSEEFAVRESASQELEQLGELAEPGLHGVLAGNPSLEVRQRVETLLKIHAEKTLPWEGERLRMWRSIQVLEGIGTPEAQAVLKTLAGGAPGSWQTREAKASLERLAKRPAVSR